MKYGGQNNMYEDMSLIERINFNVGEYVKDIKGEESETEKMTINVLSAQKYNSKKVKELRRKLSMTQNELSIILEVSPRTVESWEQGKTQPNGSARRLMDIISGHPDIVKEIIDIEVNN